DARSPLSYEIFKEVNSRDFIVAPELVRLEDGRVTESNLTGSVLLGRTPAEFGFGTGSGLRYWSDAVGDAISAAVEEHGVPSYFAGQQIGRHRRGDGFQKRFYHRMRKSWQDSVGGGPPIVCSFKLPPLLAIVLNRLNARADLLQEIRALREQLAGVRSELAEFNSLMTRSTSQAEIDRAVLRIDESFDSIVAESRLSDVERRARTMGRIIPLARPILNMMAAFVTGGIGSISQSDAANIGGGLDKVLKSSSIVDRTVTARTFAELIRVEALQSLVEHHLSPAEISAIEKTMS
ncbi:MAG TPA: hypothetical protein VIL72_11210, partial [Beijerinckiaceae bacterium]